MVLSPVLFRTPQQILESDHTIQPKHMAFTLTFSPGLRVVFTCLYCIFSLKGDTSMSETSELLRQLVAIDSINPDLVPGGAGEGTIARFVAEWLERAGLEV